LTIPPRSPDTHRLFTVATTLAISGFKVRYFGTLLGYMWSLVRPLLIFAVLYFAMTKILHFGNAIPYYPAYLITALTLFEFFSATTSEAEGSLVANQGMIRSLPVPPVAIPLSVVLRSLLDLGIKLIIVAIVIAISGVPVTTDWLQIPFLLAFLVLFAIGMAGLLSTLFVKYRDVNPIWEVVLQLLFWGSPIIYTIDSVPEQFRAVMMLNPLALLMTQVRHAVFDPSTLPGWSYLPSPAFVLIPLAIVGASLAAAVLMLSRTTPRLAEQL
jgi:ABC-2 type transport system permease protein